MNNILKIFLTIYNYVSLVGIALITPACVRIFSININYGENHDWIMLMK
jgi:hypothetical protein